MTYSDKSFPADVKLQDLIDHKDPSASLAEVLHILSLCPGDMDTDLLCTVHEDTRRLFSGEYPGYRESTTSYHNLEHTCDVFLCVGRLLHGAHVLGKRMSPRMRILTLVSSLFHDAGLIQTEDDLDGTGAKYTIGHEMRSIEFLRKYFAQHGVSEAEADICDQMISATNLGQTVTDIPFAQQEIEHGAQILATADLIAQMGDREYLEKLLLLYLEFKEAGLPYESMQDLLEKTHGFYAMAKNRLDDMLGNKSAYFLPHFTSRWSLKRDLYTESIEANMSYLHEVLRGGPETYMSKLKRGGIVQRLGKTT